MSPRRFPTRITLRAQTSFFPHQLHHGSALLQLPQPKMDAAGFELAAASSGYGVTAVQLCSLGGKGQTDPRVGRLPAVALKTQRRPRYETWRTDVEGSAASLRRRGRGGKQPAASQQTTGSCFLERAQIFHVHRNNQRSLFIIAQVATEPG